MSQQQDRPDGHRISQEHIQFWLSPRPQNSLQHVAVELLLPVAQELANHLPAQALALQQEMGYSHWCVWHKATLNEVLDALLRLPVGWIKDRLSPGSSGPSRLTLHLCGHSRHSS